MKTIFKIAKTELALLFYSPIACFLLVAFMFQCGLAYISSIESVLTEQDMGGLGLKYMNLLTSGIYAPPYGIWPGLTSKLYLYLPLLTMGLMSREINSGTIKLLYSSPIKVREIIFGKFLAMMLYNLVLLGILFLIVICGLFNIHAADAGLLFAGLFGMYLLLCSYAAIGLFMSCLTSYQVVAALSTLVLLAILSYIGTLWQDIDFVRDLAYFLSINGRADRMLQGLITTRDILYFLVIIFMFLGFSIHKLQSDRESKPWFVKAGRYVLIMVLALTLGYITSRPGMIGYWDTTATKTMTLTPNSQKIVKEMGDEPLEVTSYVNLLDNTIWQGRPEDRNRDMARWEPYRRFKPGIQFNYVYFYDSTADKYLFKYNPGMTLDSLAKNTARSMKLDMSMFKTPAEIHQMIDLRPEQNRYVMKLKYKGNTTFLRLYDDQRVFPSERETDAALKRLMQAKLPKIAFVQGELERSVDKEGDKHYKTMTNEITFRKSLINQGFDVETVSLKDQEIPTGIAALVIADPRQNFDSTVMAKVQRYIADGGNLLIAGEPGKQEMLNPLLQPLGVQLMDGILVEKSRDFPPVMIQPFLTAAATELSKDLKEDGEDSVVVSMNGAAALSYSTDGPFSVTPLVMTPAEKSWNKKIRPDQDQLDAAEDANSLSKGKDAVKMVVTLEPGDQAGPLPAIVGLTRNINGKEQRIVVAGDADFLSNSEISRYNMRTCNFDLSTAIFSWFSHGEFPIETTRPPAKDKRLNLTDSGLTFLKVLLLGILPGILLAMGTVLLIRRKRK
jgi:ABC-2 type transport system permease protein